MSSAISPLAPLVSPVLPDIEGVCLATAQAGIRYKNRTDVLYVSLSEGTAAAGVLTRSKCPSAAVDWCRAVLTKGQARVLVVNSGNSNAFTGVKGREAVELTAKLASQAAQCSPDKVYLASTGVIGEPLDASKFDGVLVDCAKRALPDDWQNAAKAIMTTDTFPKLATCTVNIDGVDITLNGFAKGAGMIAPDMATMLAFVFTDAPIHADILQAVLKQGVDQSFNCVTIDGDTSTSDTLLMFATGAAQKKGLKPFMHLDDARLGTLKEALNTLLIDLAQQVARDGEGARKLVTVKVEKAESDASAHKIAMSIANSPLVKTAIAGEDANWGRVVMAVGKAGEPANRDLLSIWFGSTRVAFQGERDASYDEEFVSNYMRNDEIEIRVELGLGHGCARIWTCDLTKAYVEINGDYRS